LLSVFGLAVYKRKRDAVAQKQEAEFKATVAETELKALRAQMNPHFIFNSLNAIGDYFSKNNKEAAYDYLAKFAKLMRQTLENSTQREILLEDELNFIELYLQLETKRLNHNFTYNIKLDENIDQQNTLVPPLILQPFIENSIWHGFSTNAGKGHVDIEIRQEANMLVCCVDDNGVGRKQAKITTAGKQSMGVEITKNRLAILNKEKQTNGQLNIIDKTNGQGVRVEVSFPLHLSF
jgi:LytS/YehU family sensor histidine kinase